MLDVRMSETGDRLIVSLGDVTLFDYVVHPGDPVLESPRPYFSPVRTLRGDVVTDCRPADHVWHKGISWSLPVVGDENFWGGPSYLDGRGYVQLPNNGTQHHVAFERIGVDAETAAATAAATDAVAATDAADIATDAATVTDAEIGIHAHADTGTLTDAHPDDGTGTGTSTARRAEIVERLRWTTQAGRDLFDESRRLSVTVLDETTWVLTFDTTMTNLTAYAIPLGSPTTRGRPDAGYGGLFWRGPASFTGGRILGPESRTDVDLDVSPDRPTGEHLRGTRAPWMGFAGEHPNGQVSTVVMIDDPGNPQHPVPWFTRTADYAGLCPAPFFHEEWIIEPGAHFRARYAVVIADGSHDQSSAARLARGAQAALDATADTQRDAHAHPAPTTASRSNGLIFRGSSINRG